jgi:hypothetical protein
MAHDNHDERFQDQPLRDQDASPSEKPGQSEQAALPRKRKPVRKRFTKR